MLFFLIIPYNDGEKYRFGGHFKQGTQPPTPARIPGDPKTISAREANKLTTDFHLSFHFDQSSHLVSSPALQLNACCSVPSPLAQRSSKSQRFSFSKVIALPGFKLQQQLPGNAQATLSRKARRITAVLHLSTHSSMPNPPVSSPPISKPVTVVCPLCPHYQATN